MTFDNPWFTFLLLSGFGLFGVELLSSWLTLKKMDPVLPAEFADTWDAAAYAKSQAYTREGESFGMLSSFIQFAVTLIFWLAGGFTWLDALTRSWFDGEVMRGLAGFSVFYLGSTLLQLPFEWWDDFHIEAKYGFNRSTKGTFIMDKVKGLLLAAVLGLPVCALLITIFERVEHAWIWAWASITVLMLAMQYVAPRWLMPLFNKFTPLADGSLKDAIQQLSLACDFPVKEVSIIDGSRRSSKANAFFAGFGRNKRIALYDTLVERHPEPELIAVLAHEIGHFKCRHILQRMGISIVQLAVVFLLMGLVMNQQGLFKAFGVEQVSIWLGFIFFMQLYGPVSHLTGIAFQYLSRKHEFEADHYAAKVTGTPHTLIAALKRLSVDSLSNLNPHPLTVWLSYSHPPLPERLAALSKAAQNR